MAYCSSYYLYQRYEKRGDQDWIPSYPNVYSIDGEGSKPLRARQMYDTDCGWIPDTEVQYRTLSGTPYCSGETGYDKYVNETYQVSYDGGITWSTTGNADVLVERNSPDCGYVPPIEPIYRWAVITPISGDSSTYICDECPIEPIYRWTVITPSSDPSTYVCDECQITPIYRWENSGTTCVACDKYNRAIQQVSYDSGATWTTVDPPVYSATTLVEADSYDCGYRTRTITSAEYCNMLDKCVDVYSQVSRDYGSTWETTATTTTVIEAGSSDCIPYQHEYFTVEAVDDMTFRFSGQGQQYYFSKDSGETWESKYDSINSNIGINAGDSVLFKASMQATTAGSWVGITRIVASGRYKVRGNINSLLYGTNYYPFDDEGWKNVAYSKYQFAYLFYGQTNLVDAEKLCIPGNIVGFGSCLSMFSGCTSLEKAPLILPATTFSGGTYCYSHMFSDCISLTTAPKLPATNLSGASYCYEGMFSGCTSLTTAPVLSASTLVTSCYNTMFSGCSSLNYIKCLATTGFNAYTCLTNWVSGVASSGTFVKDANTTWNRGNSGIPSNWTVQNA